jgi:uncharacterized membrane protein
VSADRQPEATHARLDALRETGTLDAPAHARALRLAAASPPAEEWRWFLETTLATVGTVLCVSAVIYFFAHNWELLGHYARFGIIGAGILLTTLSGIAVGPDRLMTRLSFTSAAVLCGVLLAVISQAYPTDAEAWTLFFGWGLLALPWVIAARWAPLWLFEIALGNVALVRWLSDQLSIDSATAFLWAAFVVGIANGAVLAIWILLSRTRVWMQGALATRLLALVVVAALTIGLCVRIIAGGFDGLTDNSATPTVLLVTTLVAANYGLLVAFRRRDLFMPALSCGSAILVGTAVTARVLLVDPEQSFDQVGFLLTGLAVTAMSIAAAVALSRMETSE